jgi:hypothetical protein
MLHRIAQNSDWPFDLIAVYCIMAPTTSRPREVRVSVAQGSEVRSTDHVGGIRSCTAAEIASLSVLCKDAPMERVRLALAFTVCDQWAAHS